MTRDPHVPSSAERTRPARRTGVRSLALLLTGVLLITMNEQPVAARSDADWQPPAPPGLTGVEVTAVDPPGLPEPQAPRYAVTEVTHARWPDGGLAQVSLAGLHPADAGPARADGAPEPARSGRVRAGDLPVLVGPAPLTPGQQELAALGMADVASVPSRVSVQVADRAATAAAGVAGLVVGIARADGVEAAASVTVEVDYSAFRQAYGGEWASRLRVSTLEGCGRPGRDGGRCRVGTVLPSANDHTAGRLAVTVPLSGDGGYTMLAVTAGPGGDNGTYAATGLGTAGTWQVSVQTGTFLWEYPVTVVPGLGGPEPNLALSYSSQAVDGRTVNTNSQGSWVGDGWDLWPGYIERTYRPCIDDRKPVGGQQPNNAQLETGDLCWVSDNAVLSLNGQLTELVRDGNGRWRGVADDGSRIEQRFDPSLGNGTDNGEYWVVTTTDGVQYFFGRHRRQGFPTDTAATNSTWTVPVYGNHPGEPCHVANNFAASRCTQAWRWNLDYVVDPRGNSMTLFYSRETGAYARELDSAKRTTYHRGGWLTRIEYGTRAGSEHTGPAPARVVFDVADRCLPGATCTQANPSAWPDTPWDLYCAAAPCTTQLVPTFWTQKRLERIRTQVLRGGTHETVESLTLRHLFLDAGASDGEGVPMWLAGITRTGHVTTAGGDVVADPEIVFDTQAPLANRVDGPQDGKTSINRFRIQTVYNGSGAAVTVVYSEPECTRGDLPTPHTNTRRCFPQWYGLGDDDPTLDWFHKYVVTAVYVDDGTGASPRMETHYQYLDDPAWRYDDSPLTPADERTWSRWRGYSKVRVVHGSAQETRSAVEYLYLRGMHGDRATPSGGTRTVQVTDSQGVSITDHEAYAGFLREVTVLDGPGGDWVSGTIYTPWRHGPTASDGPLRAWMTNVETVRTRTRLASGVRWTSTTTTFDTTYGMPVRIDDLGDESTADDDRCVRLEYARNTTTWLVELVSRVETVGVACSVTPDRPGDVLSDVRTFYDDPTTFGAAPTRGLPVRVQEVESWNGTTPVWVTTWRGEHDAYGRLTDAYDALDRHTRVTHTPAAGGPLTSVSTTDPAGHTTTVTYEPAWEMPVQATDENGETVTFRYDGLGRVTKVWLPGRNPAADLPDLAYEYLVRKDAPSAVTTRALLPDGTGYRTTVTLLDGAMRHRQTQEQAPGGGRVISDTVYDSRGLVAWVSRPYYDTSNAPPATTLVGAGIPQIPGVVEFVHDGVGRLTDEILLTGGTEAWRTSYAYEGDRVHVTPPAGGTATTTIVDARGRTVALRQYHGPTPSGAYDETTYTYTRRGELATVTDPAGNTWSFAYDQWGRQVAADDPDTGLVTRTFDRVGRIVTRTDARGLTLAYTYDDLDRPTSVRTGSPTGPVLAEWVYDTAPNGVGRLAKAIRHHGGAQYVHEVTGYDTGGRPTGIRLVIPPAETGVAGVYETTVTYRANGALATVQLPAVGDLPAEQLQFGYDDVGNQTTIHSPLAVYVHSATYDALGQLTQRVLGDVGKRTVVNAQYDEATSRLVGLSATPEQRPEALRLSYSYDDAGNVVRIADSPGQTTPVDTQCFRYDHLRRLTDAWTPMSTGPDNCAVYPGPIGGVAPYRLVWTYDESNNRLTQTQVGVGVTTYTYPAPGSPQPHTVTGAQLSGPLGSSTHSYAYDASGNLVEKTVDGVTQTFTWDAGHQLTSVTGPEGTTEFLYDADGNRLIRRDPTGTTLYLPGGQELRYDAASGQLSATRYYHHAGGQVAVRTAAGVTWLVTDHHNTATVAVRDADLQVQRRRSLPFGGPRGGAPAWWAGDKGFVGGTEDPTGLVHLGARLYDPELGRFISADPIMNIADPQQINGYSYANNNPVTLADPDGLSPEDYKLPGSSRAHATAVYLRALDLVARYGDKVQITVSPYTQNGADLVCWNCSRLAGQKADVVWVWEIKPYTTPDGIAQKSVDSGLNWVRQRPRLVPGRIVMRGPAFDHISVGPMIGDPSAWVVVESDGNGLERYTVFRDRGNYVEAPSNFTVRDQYDLDMAQKMFTTHRHSTRDPEWDSLVSAAVVTSAAIVASVAADVARSRSAPPTSSTGHGSTSKSSGGSSRSTTPQSAAGKNSATARSSASARSTGGLSKPAVTARVSAPSPRTSGPRISSGLARAALAGGIGGSNFLY